MRPETPEKREGASAPSHGIFYTRAGGFGPGAYALFSAITLAAMVLCVCVGSVNIPLRDTAAVVWAAVRRQPIPPVMARSIILSVRIPRVLCVALVGACLSLCGAAMQGLLKNPLADGSTLGVSSGASLGAAIAIAFEITIPFLPFALILSALMSQMNISENSKIFLLMVILGVLTWTGLARIVRAQVLAARENEYVTAAKAMGVRERNIAFKHILPNIVSIILVSLTLDFATCMLTESSLSYLGFGVTYPRPTWGNMLNGVNKATIIKNFWWQWVFTSIFLAVTCICINIIGDTLRDVIDPKSDRDK